MSTCHGLLLLGLMRQVWQRLQQQPSAAQLWCQHLRHPGRCRSASMQMDPRCSRQRRQDWRDGGLQASHEVSLPFSDRHTLSCTLVKSPCPAVKWKVSHHRSSVVHCTPTPAGAELEKCWTRVRTICRFTSANSHWMLLLRTRLQRHRH